MNRDDPKDKPQNGPKVTPASEGEAPAKIEVVDDAKVKQAVQLLAQKQRQRQQQEQPTPEEMTKRYFQDVVEFRGGDRMLCERCKKPYRLHPIFKLVGDDRTVRPLVPIPPLGIVSCGECGYVEFFAVDVLAHTIRKKSEEKQS